MSANSVRCGSIVGPRKSVTCKGAPAFKHRSVQQKVQREREDTGGGRDACEGRIGESVRKRGGVKRGRLLRGNRRGWGEGRRGGGLKGTSGDNKV